MGKKIKIFDGTKWREINSSSSTVVYYSGETIVDNNVVVTSEGYAGDEGELPTLNDVLDEIKSTTDKHERNIAWLAKHGGGGGSTGSTGTTYAISVTQPILNNGNAYVSDSSFTLKFLITNASSSLAFQYRISLDGTYLSSSYTGCKGGTIVSVKIDDINAYSTNASHSIVIEAIDPEGISLTPYTFTVREKSLKISMDNLSQTVEIGTVGAVPIKVSSKVIGYPLTLTITNQANTSLKQVKTYTVESTATATLQISILDSVNKLVEDYSAGDSFVFKADAQMTIEGGETLTSNELVFRATVTSGKDMVVVLENLQSRDNVISGIVEPTTCAIEEKLIIQFKPCIKTAYSNVYYAVKIGREGSTEEKLIVGNYYDSTLNNNGITTDSEGYKTNFYTTPNASVSCSWTVPSDDSYIGDDWNVTVKCWDGLGEKVGTATARVKIIEGNSEYYTTQIPYRSVTSTEGDILFAYWSTREDCPSVPIQTEWKSTDLNYKYVAQDFTVKPIVTLDTYAINGKTNGYLQGQNLLRLQNNAYGEIDLSKAYAMVDGKSVNLSDEINSWKDSGFTFSITYMADASPYNDKVVFFMGENYSDGTLMEGIKVTLEKVQWKINTSGSEYITIEADIQQGVKNTIDFVYRQSLGVAIIYVNGINGGSGDVSSYNGNSFTDYPIYIGCDVINGEKTNFSDIDVYNVSLFGKELNDLQIVVNAKNAKIVDKSSEDELADYKDWKARNFFYTEEGGSLNWAKSRLYEYDKANDAYKFPVDNTTFSTLIQNNPPIPVMLISVSGSTQESGDDGSAFTSGFFHRTDLSDNIVNKKFTGFKMQYYDPATQKTVVCNDVAVAIQGTSTTTLRSKNVELYINAKTVSDSQKCKLFQPKASWFPESEFTLKADVVDSAHCNNAVLGEWINNCGLFEENPAMLALKDNKPTVKDYSGNTSTATATIKYTLEGFPFILIIQFADRVYENLGIYSFNLGRYSDYNMGFKFLKEFTREDESADDSRFKPCLISDYTEFEDSITYDNGTKKLKFDDIFSYEFEAAADQNSSLYPTWSQDDLSILKYYGTFRYSGLGDKDNVPDTIWAKLQALFTKTATNNYPNCSNKYVWNGTDYSTNGTSYVPDGNVYEVLDKYLCLKNAEAYFTIATLFGMVDSLGKNFTLRTWNASDEIARWFPAFYDMDSSCALTNAGDQTVPSTAYIDSYHNKCKYVYVNDSGETVRVDNLYDLPHNEVGEITVPYTTEWNPKTDGMNPMIIDANSKDGGYGAFNSKLWNMLRDGQYSYTVHGDTNKTYNLAYSKIWNTIRTSLVTSEDDFVSIMETHMGDCGELLYNLDFNEKYLKKYNVGGKEVYGNIEMLHGNRIEYVRAWLRKRICFFDGIFDYDGCALSLIDGTTGVAIPPYYEKGYITCGGNTADWMALPLTIRTTRPVVFKSVVGQDAGQASDNNKYFIDAYTDTVIGLYNHNSQDKRITINATSIISKLDGLYNIGFQKFESMSLPSLDEINISNASTLSDNPIDFPTNFSEDELSVINLYNTSFKAGSGTFSINLSDFKKITDVDISYSCVNSISLGDAALATLKVEGSKIQSFGLENQSLLTSLNLSNCAKLTTIKISNCSSLETLTINNSTSLTGITIENCNSLKTIICKNNTNLVKFEVLNLNSLETLNMSGCSGSSLQVTLTNVGDSNNDKGLITINFGGFATTNAPIFKNCVLDKVTALDLTGWSKLTHFIYKDSDGNEIYNIDYKGNNVFNLEPFASITSDGLKIQDCIDIAYLKVTDDTDNPFIISEPLFGEGSYLTRIFGAICINGKEIFKKYSKFYLNDAYEDNKPTDDIPTILTFSDTVTDISSCFADTNLSAQDMSYVLYNTKKTIQNYTSLFSGCTRSDGEGLDLRENMENCTGAVIMDNMFFNDGLYINLYGYYVKDETRIRGTFTGFENLSSLNSTFRNNQVTVYDYNSEEQAPYLPLFQITTDDYLSTGGTGDEHDILAMREKYTDADGNFTGKTMPLKTISYFNPVVWEYCVAETLLYFLPNLSIITNSFNNMGLYFIDSPNQTTVDEKGAGLFWNNPKLQEISFSFNSIGNMRSNALVLDKLFAGCTGLKILSNAFSFVDMDGGICHLKIGSDFLSSCTGLTELSATYDKPLFSGDENIFEKTIDEDTIYDCFSGFTKLTALEFLFVDTVYEDIFDGDRFINSLPTTITSLKGLFARTMFKGLTLSKGVFSHLPRLTDVSFLFAKNTEMDIPIPYGLFSGCTIRTMDHFLSGATTYSNYTMDWDSLTGTTITDVVDFGLLTENGGQYLWNQYIFDGSTDSYNKIVTLYDGLKDSYTIENPSDVFTYNDYSYICPPDIFKYCDNNATIYAFFDDSNVVGKVPEILFDSVYNTTSLSCFFGNCSNIKRYSTDYNGIPNVMFSPLTFSKLSKLTDISGLFQGLNFEGSCIPTDLFANNNSIQTARQCFRNSKWGGFSSEDYSQCPSPLIKSSTLSDIAEMFFGVTGLTISKNLFNYTDSISNASKFLCNAITLNGVVPELWNYAGIKINPSNAMNAYGNLGFSSLEEGGTLYGVDYTTYNTYRATIFKDLNG